MLDDRELDLILLGATGFAGRLTAGYLAGHAPPGLRIGLAGRSERRLAEVRAGLGAAAQAWPLIAAGADGAGDLEDTTLVVTAMRGGISGGTLASVLGQIDDMRASAGSRRIVTDPYALSPDRAAEPGPCRGTRAR